LDQEGQPGSPNVEETHGPQGSNDDESPIFAVHYVQDLEHNMIYCEADSAEEAEKM